MTLYTIYRQKEYIKYFTTIISKATLFQIIFSFIPLFVSLISAYRAYGFYKTSSFVFTQPTINLRSDMILQFFRNGGAVNTWSNLMPFTSNIVPSISIYENDVNYDGVKESANISIRVYKSDVIGLRFLLQFDYTITGISTVQLQQPIIVNVESLSALGRIGIVGRLGMIQTRRLPSYGNLTLYNNMLLNSSSTAQVLNDAFDLVIQNVSARNFTLKLKDSFTTFDPLAPSTNYVDINIVILYGPEVLQFHTEFWSMVKWAWVQWFYFLVLFLFCFQRFKEFVYDSYTVSARKKSTQQHECDSVPKYASVF